MKNWVWIAVTFAVTYVILSVFKIPFVLFLIVGMPVLLIIFTYASFTYSFRASLKPEPIPQKGYESRRNELEKEAASVVSLGFNKFDEFYLKMIPDSITYAFKQNPGPVYLCIYHLGAKKACDFVSFFENDIALTTAGRVDSGMAPRPAKRLLQIFENAPYQVLLQKHIEAQDFIKSKGIKQIDIREPFRNRFMWSLREFRRGVTQYSFWPLRLIYWTLAKRGKKYLKSIEEQHRAGMIAAFK